MITREHIAEVRHLYSVDPLYDTALGQLLRWADADLDALDADPTPEIYRKWADESDGSDEVDFGLACDKHRPTDRAIASGFWGGWKAALAAIKGAHR